MMIRPAEPEMVNVSFAPGAGLTWKQTCLAAAAPIVRVSSAVSAPVSTIDPPHAGVAAALWAVAACTAVAACAAVAGTPISAASKQAPAAAAERTRLIESITADVPLLEAHQGSDLDVVGRAGAPWRGRL
jgi:hypothetical protein